MQLKHFAEKVLQKLEDIAPKCHLDETKFSSEAVIQLWSKYLKVKDVLIEAINSVPSKAVCREIGPALWKIGSTDFVRMSEKDGFSW